jgi:hypothetical protein
MGDKNWVLTTAEKDPSLAKVPFIVEYLDENFNVRPHSEESYPTFDYALARARWANENGGHNVRVVQELAFCFNQPKEPS